MNTLKLLAVKNGTLRIAKVRYKNAIHIKSNNPTTISYLLKMEEGGRAQEARLKQRFLEKSAVEANDNYCRISSKCSEQWQYFHSKGFLEWELSAILVPFTFIFF